MAYADIYNAATDNLFQGRCMAALWARAQVVVNEDPRDPVRFAWAQNVLKDKAAITPRQVAMQVLRNSTIAANPGQSPDGDIEFQIVQVLDDLIAIG